MGGLPACGGQVVATHTVSPAEARRDALRPLAIIRSTKRIPLPEGARVDRGEITLVASEPVEFGAVIEQDAAGQVIAVRHTNGRRVVFRPGTAAMSRSGDSVRGVTTGPDATLELLSHDRIEVESGPRQDVEPARARPSADGVASSEVSRPTGLLIGGATVLLLAYAPTAYFGAASKRSADRELLIPVAGPFMAFAKRPNCTPPPGSELIPVDPCIEETATRGALITSGAMQTFGALLVALWLPPRTVSVGPASATPKTRPARQANVPSIAFVPMGAGAAAVGTF